MPLNCLAILGYLFFFRYDYQVHQKDGWYCSPVQELRNYWGQNYFGDVCICAMLVVVKKDKLSAVEWILKIETEQLDLCIVSPGFLTHNRTRSVLVFSVVTIHPSFCFVFEKQF